MKYLIRFVTLILFLLLSAQLSVGSVRIVRNFDSDWRFYLGNQENSIVIRSDFDDSGWRLLDLPHDWSIEGEFSESNPAGAGGGYLPGGIGWYRKTFSLPDSIHGKIVFIDFDGIYQNSEMWINGHYLGKRPYGYSSFRYELTPYLRYGTEKNVIAVRVDNSDQPNSRWYSGSGIYRNVHLVVVNKLYVDHWGTYITTPVVNGIMASVQVETHITNSSESEANIQIYTQILDQTGKSVNSSAKSIAIPEDSTLVVTQTIQVNNPKRWSVDQPYLYTARTKIRNMQKVYDDYTTKFGIRTFRFDSDSGFFLNDKPVKIKGVCLHHDLGPLGAAVNKRAIERQLEILKEMGCNGIRTSHNPPAPELLELTDQMGFIVMDEAFDVWKKQKTKYDYHLYWDDWHRQDLQDMILRDRNHPSVFIWSIGNEIQEQWDSTGVSIARELASITTSLDPTRPVTAGLNDPAPHNMVYKSGVLDLVGFNYHHQSFATFPETFPNDKFIATETTSALETRGSYDMPSDSLRIWPVQWDKPVRGNPDHSCSAYDNCRVGWGSTHRKTWEIIKNHSFLSGMFVWTGFDYIGEPTPYTWPSRSSYFGIVDLAGFPKDAYYLYQSEWTDKPVLHLFPHWNWEDGETVDVWVYSNLSRIRLFLNSKDMSGNQLPIDDTLHKVWRVKYEPGILRAEGFTDSGKKITQTVKTAGPPKKIQLTVDRNQITANGKDLAFVTATILDSQGVPVPEADNLLHFALDGPGTIAADGNGSQTSHEPFISNQHRAFHGKCLIVVKSQSNSGEITLQITAEGLSLSSITIRSKR